ncbi:hypothetical protein ACLOJK_002026 [Asimina triloba]
MIEPECIIGQHSILMEGSLVETQSILEAGSVLPPGRRIPTGELWAGNPARFVRSLTHEEILEIPKLAVAINDLSRSHFSEFLPYSTVYLEVSPTQQTDNAFRLELARIRFFHQLLYLGKDNPASASGPASIGNRVQLQIRKDFVSTCSQGTLPTLQ